MSTEQHATLQEAGPSGDADIDALRPWFHNLHLPDGRQTSPHHRLGDFPRFKWERIARHLPERLEGWTVLDIGCNAGFYTLELAARGAYVTAIDIEEHYLRQARWAIEQFELQDRVELRCESVYDLLGRSVQYDLVWFMGVLYHLRYPLLALDLVARSTRKLAIVQTLMLPEQQGEELVRTDVRYEDRVLLADPRWPSMAFVPDCFAGDPTNWWVPNKPGFHAMLRAAGLDILSEPDEEACICRPAPNSRSDDQLQAVQNALRAT